MEQKPKLTSSKFVYLNGKKIEINCWKHNSKLTKEENEEYIKKCQLGAKTNKVSVFYYLTEFDIKES